MNDTAWNETAPFSVSSVSRTLSECLRANDADLRPEAPFALAAVAYWRKLTALRIMTAEECDRRIQDDDARRYLSDFAARYEEAIGQAASQTSIEELQAAILGMRPDTARRRELPTSLARLAFRMLDVHEGESLLFVGTELSGFIEEACSSLSGVRLTALAEDRSLCRILNIRAAVMGWSLQMLEGDIFSVALDGLQADKIFLDATMTERFAEKSERLTSDPALRDYFTGTKLRVSEGVPWAVLLTALRKVSPGGMAVGMMSRRALMEPGVSVCREKLAREGRIGAVVALPEDLDDCRLLRPYFLMCGDKASGLRLVDASDVHTSIAPAPPKGAVGYRSAPRKTLTPENIETIMERLRLDGDRSRMASVKELKDRGFSFLPDADFLADDDFFRGLSGGKPLSEICRIYRGAVTFSSKSLEERFSETPTPFRYLQLKDVQGGILRGPLPYLTDIDEKQEAYCAKNGALVMGKNAPMRVSILDLPEDALVLLGGNIYAMEVTSEDHDPVYVMAYLQSADGMRQMNHFLKGRTAVQVLSIKDLANIKIPSRPIDEQRAVAQRYRELHAKMERLLDEAESIRKELDALPG